MSLTKTRDELVKVKVNESRNRPGVAQRVPGGLKVIPQQTEVAQGVPGSLRPRIFLTFRHYKGGRSSAIRTGRLYPRRNPWYSLSEAELTSGHMVLSGIPRKKSPVTPPGIDPGTVRLVAQRLNHYATPGPSRRFRLQYFMTFDK